jgi:hypothetical protein
MTKRTFLTVLCLLLVTVPLVACSKQESQQPASVTQSQPPLAATPQTTPAVQGLSAAARKAGARQMAADYKKQCAGQGTPPRDCEILRSLLVAEVVIALEMTERSKDQRGTTQALAALDRIDEPAIVVAASRILGRFPDTPGIAAKVEPLVLRSRFLEVQRVAAELLKAGPDTGLGEIGGLWLQNHGGVSGKTDYEEYPDFPAHYASLGFPNYPKAEWFSPADSDRSIGWSTTESATAVTRWFSDALKTPALGVEQWLAERDAAVKLPDPSKMVRMQQLAEKAVKGDAAARAELEKLQKEFEGQAQSMERAAKQSVADILPPSSSMAAARWIVAQRKDGRVSRVVLVYPLQGLKRTVIQLAWDLTDYPSAWPPSRQ